MNGSSSRRRADWRAAAVACASAVAARRQRAEAPIASSIRFSTSPQTFRAQAVLVGAVDRGYGHLLRARERRLEAPVEREALQRVVGRAGAVEVAPEPAGAELLARRADLPEVAGGEVRLVGARVADAGYHRDLALAVQLGEPGERGVPAEAAVLGERQPAEAGKANRGRSFR